MEDNTIILLLFLFHYCYSCFINDVRVHYGLFLIPLFILLIFNTVSFFLVIRVILKHRKINQEKNPSRLQLIKTVIIIFCLMSIFGVFWLLGAASVKQAAVFFNWPFILLNTSQGILLFVFIVVINGREEWKNLLTCNRYVRKKKKYPVIIDKSSKVNSHSNSKSYELKCTSFSNPVTTDTLLKDNDTVFESSENPETPENLTNYKPDTLLKAVGYNNYTISESSENPESPENFSPTNFLKNGTQDNSDTPPKVVNNGHECTVSESSENPESPENASPINSLKVITQDYSTQDSENSIIINLDVIEKEDIKID